MIEPSYHEKFGEYKVDTGSFTKHNWKSAESREAWSEWFESIPRAKGHVEWRSVLDPDTDRKAAIIHVNNINREQWLQRISEHDLHYRPIRFNRPYDGYAHEFTPADPQDPERVTYAVIAEDPDIADKMEEAETEMQGRERHDTVGELLGFPECCRNFFYEDWVNGCRDPMYEISCNTPSAEMVDDDPNHVHVMDPNTGTNIMWRYFGISYITHMPCSWECEESIEIARERYRIMKETGFGDEADRLNEWLEQPFVWSGYHGMAHIQNTHATCNVNSSNYLDEKRVIWRGDYEVQ